MTASLIEMFGAGAQSVAKGQPGGNDVGGHSGICWDDLSRALERRAR